MRSREAHIVMTRQDHLGLVLAYHRNQTRRASLIRQAGQPFFAMYASTAVPRTVSGTPVVETTMSSKSRTSNRDPQLRLRPRTKPEDLVVPDLVATSLARGCAIAIDLAGNSISSTTRTCHQPFYCMLARPV